MSSFVAFLRLCNLFGSHANGQGGIGSRLHSWRFSHLTAAVRDDADGGAVQSHEVSHLSEPILVNVNCLVDLLVGDEIPTD
jgi:hypothetical protein